MIRALHLVHNTEWQKGLQRGYMRADLMCTQTPPPSQCTTEHPIYCPAIVCSALSSIEAKCLGPLNTTLDTIDGQRGAGSWQKWDGDIHIPPINMNTHTYGMQIHIRHTHTQMYSIIHTFTSAQRHQAGTAWGPDLYTSSYGVGYTRTRCTYTQAHTQKQGLESLRQRVERMATVRIT